MILPGLPLAVAAAQRGPLALPPRKAIPPAARARPGHSSARSRPASGIEAGKSQLKGQITLSLESPASGMFRVASSALYGEPFLPLDETLARIDAITSEQVADVCQSLFLPDRQTVVTLGRSVDLP